MISDDKLYYAEEYEDEEEDPKKVKEGEEGLSANFYCFVFNLKSINCKWFNMKYHTIVIIKS